MLVAPLVIGTIAAVSIAASGGALSDTPIVFAVVLATIGAGAGVIARNRQATPFRT